MDVTQEMVDAAIGVLRESFEMGAYARVNDYIRSDMSDNERAAAIRALKEADKAAEDRVEAVVKAALEAALNVTRGEK